MYRRAARGAADLWRAQGLCAGLCLRDAGRCACAAAARCGPSGRARGTATNGMLTIVIDPSRLIDREWLRDEIAAMTGYITASPPRHPDEPVLIPGDPERLTARRAHQERCPDRRRDLARAHRRRARRQRAGRSASLRAGKNRVSLCKIHPLILKTEFRINILGSYPGFPGSGIAAEFAIRSASQTMPLRR